ncbi:MAG: alcohol dehydrogenase catalytic domain-containing protein [Victivallales bacterium]|nr:alcohol dehydrogenase catalytic domain-containing protein [Victivallales bacterium]
MKAIIKASEAAGSVQIADVPIPEIKPGEVLVRLKGASICYSDVSILNNKYIGRNPVPIPLVMGHEGAGIVEAMAPGVKGYKVGDRVALEPISGCGYCSACKSGFKNMCPNWKHIGITCDGVFAEYISVGADQLHLLPDNISFAEAALVEPLGLVVRSLEQSKPMLGETVAIVGPGSLGMMHLLAYKAAGASEIIMVGLEKDRERLKLAEKHGAHSVILDQQQDPIAAIKEITGGSGVDIAVETANSPKAVGTCFDIIAARGRIVLFGLYPEAVISPVKMLRNGVTVYGDVGAISRQFSRAIEWLKHKKVNLSDVITGRFNLDQGIQAFESTRNSGTIKIVFEI